MPLSLVIYTMIRTVTILSAYLFCASAVLSQTDALNRILKLEPHRVLQLTPKPEANTVIIPSSFSEESLRKAVKKPKGTVQTVYYIYTGYRQSPSFDQKALNKERIQRLSEQIPEVLQNRYVEWKIIEQTGCSSPQIGRTYFHGFVLEYRPEVSSSDREKEIANLETFLKNPKAGFAMESDPTSSKLSVDVQKGILRETKISDYWPEPEKIDRQANFPEGNLALYEYFKKNIPAGGEVSKNRDDEWVPLSFQVDENGTISDVRFSEVKVYMQRTIEDVLESMPKWDAAIKDGTPISSRVNIELRMSYSPIVRGMYNRDGKKPKFTQDEAAAIAVKNASTDEQTEERILTAEKSAVYRSMEEVITREKIAMVMDVTTSMSLHLASMNWWIANSADSLNVVHYTFFNDGNNIDDKKKKSGKTGGIYHGTELRDLPATLMEAMRAGNGGDLVENDFEAVLEAQNKQNNAEALLLIVDNFSDVRDENLLSQIQMKTHVLIAGDVTFVRECYLNLAKKTGGGILVNGKRINLENVKEGGRITIANSTYSFNGKEFKLL
ncbi:hypothetical protein OAK35_01670 [Crocinitomicaceae bacterium]|nr:hypothetical protein [Crocinitomicaceae bacterium]